MPIMPLVLSQSQQEDDPPSSNQTTIAIASPTEPTYLEYIFYPPFHVLPS